MRCNHSCKFVTWSVEKAASRRQSLADNDIDLDFDSMRVSQLEPLELGQHDIDFGIEFACGLDFDFDCFVISGIIIGTWITWTPAIICILISCFCLCICICIELDWRLNLNLRGIFELAYTVENNDDWLVYIFFVAKLKIFLKNTCKKLDAHTMGFRKLFRMPMHGCMYAWISKAFPLLFFAAFSNTLLSYKKFIDFAFFVGFVVQTRTYITSLLYLLSQAIILYLYILFDRGKQMCACACVPHCMLIDWLAAN